MAEYKNIFAEDVEVPDAVMQKVNAAFAAVKTEDVKHMEEKNKVETMKKRKGRFFRNRAAAACVCLFAAAGITVVAAAHHVWSRGMQGTLQATDKQQQALTEKEVAVVLSESENQADLAVSSGNVTVTPETVIADERFAYLSFSVKGFALEEGEEPSFESTLVYLGEDPAAQEGWVNMNASFYNGIVPDENGQPVYEDKTAPEFLADGSLVFHYADAEGTLEYVIQVSVPDQQESLLGKTLHVNLENLGIARDAEYAGRVEGNWDFSIELPAVSAAAEVAVEKQVEGTAFVMDSAEISPVSIRINYSVNGDVEVSNDDNGIPEFGGVVLADGTRLPFLKNGGSSGYTDENRNSAYELSAFDRVIDPKQVTAILVRTELGADLVEVPVGG